MKTVNWIIERHPDQTATLWAPGEKEPIASRVPMEHAQLIASIGSVTRALNRILNVDRATASHSLLLALEVGDRALERIDRREK